MTASRTSVAVLVLALSAFGALAQGQDEGATAPPRQLGAPGAEPSDVSTEGLKDDTLGNSAKEVPDAQGSAEDGPGDVSTEGLLDDNEDVPPKAAPGPVLKMEPGAAEPATPVVTRPEKVEVGTLGNVDGGAVGILGPGSGGFDSSIWSGSLRADIEVLLAKAPLSSSDSAVRSLARRVILSTADPPPGAFKRAWVALRIDKLLAAGMLDDAGTLAASVDARDDSDLARTQANAILLSGRTKDVCGGGTEARLTESESFWLQLRAFCAASSGDAATADITRSVMDAQGKSDTSYDVLANDVLTGAKKPPGKIANPTALHFYLLRKAGLPVPADDFSPFGPAASIVAMRDPRNAPEKRLAAAERIVRTGAASNADLKAVVDAQVISADQTANALATAPKLSFLKGQALLRRAAQLESRPSEKAALLHEALVLGDKAGLFEVAANLQANVAVTLKAQDVAPGDGPLIGWALLLAGKPAETWLGGNDVARAVLGLATGKDDAAQSALSSIAARMKAGAEKAQNVSRPMEALLLGIYAGLGLTLPADANAEAAAIRATHFAGRRPDDAAMQKMLLAAATPGRKGEAILRILDIVGAKGPGDLAPDITVEIVRALEEMGARDAARAFALHALLLYRPGIS